MKKLKNFLLIIAHYIEVWQKMRRYTCENIVNDYNNNVLYSKDYILHIFNIKKTPTRFNIYFEMEKFMNDDNKYWRGYCSVLNQSLSDPYIDLSDFPELMFFKPKNPYSAYWFNPNNKHIRKLIIAFIIKNYKKQYYKKSSTNERQN